MYGVDLLAFYRSQPNGNHLAATITRVRGFIRPVFEANTLSFGNAGLRIANFDEDPLDISNIPINGPDEDWLAWFPAALITPATASFPAEYANWNERWRLGSGCQGAAQAQRASALSLALCGPPPAGQNVWYYDLSVGMKLH